ncbi:MAG: hypothetical protein RL660_2353 [Bacteroidota bacterium]
MATLKKYYYFALALIGLILFGFIYRLFFTQTPIVGGSSFGLLYIAVGAALGAALIYVLMQKFSGQSSSAVTKADHTFLLNKIERVFKVVCAEGHFSEVFDYSHTSKFAMFIPSTKKALLIVHGKVLMGYDFKKAQLEQDATTGAVRFVKFPEPEVLSIEQDLKYYNMDNGLFNKFDSEDLTALQQEARTKVLERVAKSDLPSIAQNQMQHLLAELQEVHQVKIATASELPMIAAPSAE